ncbi:hypothetical protein N0V82_007281 [Gnomoniopsis sp. IMI 355080]|nr:hypothetical protein N0V82_007281 [Gnomoniopsis sp. IMI 355080]
MRLTSRLFHSSITRMAVNLVPLPEVERLSPICIRILGGNPSKFTLQGTNTYLLGSGSERLLIDTAEGKPSWIAALKRTLAEENATISSTLLTHWHPDHVGGVGDVLNLAAEPAAKPKVYKNRPDAGQLDIVDGQQFSVEGATLTAHYTPGHANDHMVFTVKEEEGAMFTGDNVLGQGTAVFEDLATYLTSLERMSALYSSSKGRRAYPGHGPAIDDGPARIREYVSHRQQREDQIVSTLRETNELTSTAAWEPIELVRVIYKDVPESLHLPAQGGVKQVLQKLEREGRAYEESGRWILQDRPGL